MIYDCESGNTGLYPGVYKDKKCTTRLWWESCSTASSIFRVGDFFSPFLILDDIKRNVRNKQAFIRQTEYKSYKKYPQIEISPLKKSSELFNRLVVMQ